MIIEDLLKAFLRGGTANRRHQIMRLMRTHQLKSVRDLERLVNDVMERSKDHTINTGSLISRTLPSNW